MEKGSDRGLPARDSGEWSPKTDDALASGSPSAFEPHPLPPELLVSQAVYREDDPFRTRKAHQALWRAGKSGLLFPRTASQALPGRWEPSVLAHWLSLSVMTSDFGQVSFGLWISYFCCKLRVSSGRGRREQTPLFLTLPASQSVWRGHL